ncbi:MAG: hypothetical protein GC179_04010 [Anaerolineaceae bacterium]|nr:hypothetical protein [Anaerolineaceae bacterium]
MGLIAGILLVLLSFAHNIYGERKQIHDLKALTNDPIMIGSLRVMIFQGGVLLLAVGIIQILIGLGAIELVGIARFFPVGIVLLDFVTFLAVTALFHRELFRITIPQIILFVLIIVLLLVSISG